MADLWSAFESDPRDPALAGVRASDRDRDVVLQILGDAYADGRLTREEFDERSDQVATSRTLGQLPPFLTDLAPVTSLVKRPAGASTPEQLRQQATEKYRRHLREAIWTCVSASLVCVVIWLATSLGFFWPGFVIVGTGINAGRLLFMRSDVIDEEVRSLQRKQEKAQEKAVRKAAEHDAKPRELDTPEDGD